MDPVFGVVVKALVGPTSECLGPSPSFQRSAHFQEVADGPKSGTPAPQAGGLHGVLNSLRGPPTWALVSTWEIDHRVSISLSAPQK